MNKHSQMGKNIDTSRKEQKTSPATKEKFLLGQKTAKKIVNEYDKFELNTPKDLADEALLKQKEKKSRKRRFH